ncbi:MFS transporter [Sphingobium jiangsuense]|uniref:Putative MFS family arabinose efflux permease n=2 Tax=Sphingobium jiangsuense TaxID=870476 RepID=A0A7W6BQ72_9SPHN|nr:MFS transporter [Sphingobium jiangsuense]MBB3926723.1 putative MFS family arabinose efflux permease [Sphingobium jiangsuense]GLT02403.1 MFS transporter [Sphingobium jiangsuense]
MGGAGSPPTLLSGLNEGRPGRTGAMMAMLLIAYTLNFIDRQIVGILAVPIKADLGLSDQQLGLMGGLAFALFYSGLGIPIARLADRHDRGLIMTVALALWSLMTAVCGLAQNFWQIFAARLGVGIGEAGGVAPAYSLISDIYPADRRARALAIYSFGIPIGSASGIVFGGVIATLIDWRYAFFIVGLIGLCLAPLFRKVVRDPRADAPAPSPATAAQERAGIGAVLALLARKPSFWLLAVGASCSSMMGYGLFFWLPSFLVRSFGITLLSASLHYGAILLVGGIAGIWLGGKLADDMGKRSRGAYALIPAVAFVATVPFYAAGISAQSILMAIALLLVPTALGLVWLGPIIAAVQGLVPVTMRTTASAIFLFINNLIGIGIGTPAIGWLSDYLKASHGGESLRHAILWGTCFYVAAAALLLFAARFLARDWHEEASPSA